MAKASEHLLELSSQFSKDFTYKHYANKTNMMKFSFLLSLTLPVVATARFGLLRVGPAPAQSMISREFGQVFLEQDAKE